MRIANSESNRSPAEKRCSPRASFSRPPRRRSTFSRSAGGRPRGRQSSRMLQLEHATCGCLASCAGGFMVRMKPEGRGLHLIPIKIDAAGIRIMGAMQTLISDEVVLPPEDVLARFNMPGPRYTSYPTADRFVEGFDAAAFQSCLTGRIASSAARPLSLYVHLPFCNTVCYYCACNKVVTKDHGRTREYLRALEIEAGLVSTSLLGSRKVEQLHFGGGTPTFLDADEIRGLMGMLARNFELVGASASREFSIEIDPRTCPPAKVDTLAKVGFNRMSVGVQDFDPVVQKAVNRVQGFDTTQATITAAREC